MCANNARRDDFLLRPLPTKRGLWQPLRPMQADMRTVPAAPLATFPIKRLKWRSRAAAMQARRGDVA